MSQGPTPSVTVDADGVAWIVFDDPVSKVNLFTEEVMTTLSACLEEVREGIQENRVRGCVVWSDKPDSFFAGADVRLIEEIHDPAVGEAAARRGQAIFMELSRLPVPTVAAIHGVCVGGGTELALACDHRIASDSPETRLGSPEVQLGILPAWGGTTLMPRLIGLAGALSVVLEGRLMPASAAHRIGLVDRVCPTVELRRRARELALSGGVSGEEPCSDTPSRSRDAKGGTESRSPPVSRTIPGRWSRWVTATAPVRRLLLAEARRTVMRRTGGHYPAPLKILEVLARSAGRPVEEGLELEARALGELIASPVSKNLIHVFHLRERARKGIGVLSSAGGGSGVSRIGIVGGGTRVGRLAQLLAFHNLHVHLVPPSQKTAESAMSSARAAFREAVRRGKCTEGEASARLDRIVQEDDRKALARTDVVILTETAVSPSGGSVVAAFEEVIHASCLLVPLDMDRSMKEWTQKASRPHNICGLKLFDPIHTIPLAEVVRGEATDDECLATVCSLALEVGKVPVVVRDGPALLVDRIRALYLNEAAHLAGEGLSPEVIDGVARSFGMPVGPLRMADDVGLRWLTDTLTRLTELHGEGAVPAPALTALVGSGHTGSAGGNGFYRYRRGRERGPSKELARSPTQAPESGEIEARLFLVMVNEAARILEEGVAARAGDVDLALIMGAGFPPFRGGLLRYADQLGPPVVLEGLEALSARIGPRFSPSGLLREMAHEKRFFYQGDA